MWKQMLLTEQLEIQMDESNHLLEVRLSRTEQEETAIVRLNHAELIQILHTLLEINRSFRGDISYFHSVQVQVKHSSIS
ncbi:MULTISPECIES: hypothetical protein [unclassified Paenibacillus]|uniref:hypothetical protein n=1 Tax=unclassified Paenibacillus TaxID=185978 RepID=UPI00278ADBF4|nr:MULTISPECIES: hypothetical protein [unclassified Paenibacillus]MDQ0897375.1 hypothetical protein [Paenibacillus sp. V4I7]MDQ0916481.1 hypothetical protein [Paenibacillus sp. V4I5]